MDTIDNPITTSVLVAFQKAWDQSTHDYAQRQLNGEHTLQAALYHYLRSELTDEYIVYSEAVVNWSEGSADDIQKRKVVIDLLICRQSEIIVGIELKFTPRGQPTAESLKKDVLSLSRISNRRNKNDRVAIEMPRFRNTDADALVLTIAPLRKLVIAVYCKQESSMMSADNFWSSVQPLEGYWKGVPAMPKQLGVALARTDQSGTATCEYFGGPFNSLHSELDVPA
jgi:hypothetical protein